MARTNTTYYTRMRYYEVSGTAYVYWEDRRGRWLCARCRSQGYQPVRRRVGQWVYGREIPWCQICREPFEVVEEKPSLLSDARSWLRKLTGLLRRDGHRRK